MQDENDKSNEELCGFFPDVSNRKFKYVIEIDGKVHQEDWMKKKDERKNLAWTTGGYFVFRLEAYNNKQYNILVDWIKDLRVKTTNKKKELAVHKQP